MSALTRELNKAAPARPERGGDKGRLRPLVRAQDQQGRPSATAAGPNERLLFSLQALIGQHVRVQVSLSAAGPVSITQPLTLPFCAFCATLLTC